jgi:hypothetical protein
LEWRERSECHRRPFSRHLQPLSPELVQKFHARQVDGNGAVLYTVLSKVEGHICRKMHSFIEQHPPQRMIVTGQFGAPDAKMRANRIVNPNESIVGEMKISLSRCIGHSVVKRKEVFMNKIVLSIDAVA